MNGNLFETAVKALSMTPAARWCVANAGKLLLGAGIAASAGSSVMAARAGIQTVGILDEDCSRAKKAAKLAKAYAPAVALEVVSGGALIASHVQMHSKLIAATTAFNGMAGAFNAYRANVVADQGEDKDWEYLTGTAPTLVAGTDAQDGQVILVPGRPEGMTVFARCFDRYNAPLEWTDDMALNIARAQQIEDWANRMLRANGHVWAKDIFNEFGFSLAGCGYISMMGYLASDFIDEDGNLMEHPIDFGLHHERNAHIWDMTRPMAANDGIWLDFRGMTPIYDRV